MTDGNDSAFAYPHENSDGTIQHNVNRGLTKREYFAAMAAQGMFTNELVAGPDENKAIASDAVNFADALIEALNAPQSEG